MRLISLNSIATHLRVDCRIVNGIALGLGIDVCRVATIATVTSTDADRIIAAYRGQAPPKAKPKPKRRSAATA